MSRSRRREATLLTVMSGGAVLYTISGTVYDADGSTAVASATVALGALTATSAANGTYTISNIPAGTSGFLTCTKTGYSWSAITVSGMTGNLTAQNFVNSWYASGGILAAVIAAYKAIGVASKANSQVDILGSGNNLVEQGTVTWDAANGWSAFSAANYFNGAYNWSIGYSYALRCTASAEAGYKRALYARDTSEYLIVIPHYTGGIGYAANNGHQWQFTGITSGVIVITPTKCYVDGVAATEITPLGGSYTGTQWAVGKGTSTYFSGKEQALEIINGDLTEAQILILTSAMAALTNP